MIFRQRKLNSLLLAFFLYSTAIQSQKIEGMVLKSTDRSAVPYVNIVVKGTSLGTVTKFDGKFKLDVTNRPQGNDSLKFSAIGYDEKTIGIKPDMDTIFVRLHPTSVALNSVLVSPKKPEEYIQMAVDNIPKNYVNQPFNGTIYQQAMIRLNGKFMESTKAIMKGRIMPITNEEKDSTRIKMIAFQYFDEEEEAIKSIVSKKRKRKGDKMAIKGLDSIMLNLGRQMGENFDIYTQMDSNLIRQLYEHGPQTKKTKYWFENLIEDEGRQIMSIGFKGRLAGIADQKGSILLDYESLAIEGFNIQIRSSSFKIRAVLKLMGINFNGVDAIVRFKSIQSEGGWIPDLVSGDIFIDLERIKIFSKNIPIRVELNIYTRFLEIEVPATDMCLDGRLIKKKTYLQDQFKSDPNNPAWKKYQEKISSLR